MNMSIRNPHVPVTVSTVRVTWYAAKGGSGNKLLTLESASLGGTFWSGTNTSGDYTITPASAVTIPGNNATSTITFNFDKNYQNINGSESITITLSTPGCEGIIIHKP
jgi:hypothetical protein